MGFGSLIYDIVSKFWVYVYEYFYEEKVYIFILFFKGFMC